MQKLLFVYYYSDNLATSQIWKVLPIWFSPDLGGEEMAAFWACVCKLTWTLFSPAWAQRLYGAGRKERSGTGPANRFMDQPWNTIPKYILPVIIKGGPKKGKKYQTNYDEADKPFLVPGIYMPHVLVCLFVCLFACLFVCLFVCLPYLNWKLGA